MNLKRLYIAFPAYDGRLMASTFISLMNTLKDGSPVLEAMPYVDILYGESHVNRVRNTLAARFLKTDCTHILWIDSDIGNSPEQIRMLLERDLPVIAGLYSKKKTGPAQWVLNPLNGIDTPDDTGLIEVKRVGTGFVLMAREVFQAMIDHNLKRQEKNKEMLRKVCGILDQEDSDYLTKLCSQDNIEYQDDSDKKMGTCWNFFHAGVVGDQWVSEDWWFSDVARDLGFKLYADTKCQLVHVGHVDYPIKP